MAGAMRIEGNLPRTSILIFQFNFKFYNINVTIYQIFADEMGMTLTLILRMGQGQIIIIKKKIIFNFTVRGFHRILTRHQSLKSCRTARPDPIEES